MNWSDREVGSSQISKASEAPASRVISLVLIVSPPTLVPDTNLFSNSTGSESAGPGQLSSPVAGVVRHIWIRFKITLDSCFLQLEAVETCSGFQETDSSPQAGISELSRGWPSPVPFISLSCIHPSSTHPSAHPPILSYIHFLSMHPTIHPSSYLNFLPLLFPFLSALLSFLSSRKYLFRIHLVPGLPWWLRG